MLEHQRYSTEQGSTNKKKEHHRSTDSLDEWQETYLDSNSNSQQPYSGFSSHQNGWPTDDAINGNSFSGSQYGNEVDEYSSVLRTSSYALLSLGPKSITGTLGGNSGKQPGHFHSLPYIGGQVLQPSTNTQLMSCRDKYDGRCLCRMRDRWLR